MIEKTFKLLWIVSFLCIPLTIIDEVFSYLGIITSLLTLYIIVKKTLNELNNII